MTDNERASACQTEIRRLKSVIREKLKIATVISYQTLYELWVGFEDTEAPKEVIRIYESNGLGDIDAISFMAFCYGYEKAIQKNKGTTG
jgi:hypothetical protein